MRSPSPRGHAVGATGRILPHGPEFFLRRAWQAAGTDRLLLLAALFVYLLAVQLPTVAINIPLNNTVQALDLDGMDEAELEAARRAFERRRTYWNSFRTVFASLASVLLRILLLRLQAAA